MKWLAVIVSNLLLVGAAGVGAELVARSIETPTDSTVPYVADDPELGWVPQPDVAGSVTTAEYTISAHTNDLGLYDEPFDADADRDALRVLALGDSHTAASGVSTGEAWPDVLERVLSEDLGRSVVVYNAGVGAYSLDQYLVRMRKLEDVLDPHIIVIGFSTATDFYDIGRLPDGGFVYGNGIGRVYFGLDDDGKLVEHRELVGEHFDVAAQDRSSWSLSIRGWLNELALFRLTKRSKFATWVAVHWSPGGESLWPGLDTALKVHASGEDQRRLALADRIIGQIAAEAHADGRGVVLLQIPYLAQVYDDIWNASFGTAPERYRREMGSQRLADIAERHGVIFVDALPAMRIASERIGRRLHYAHDAHPTPEGQAVIARVLAPVVEDMARQFGVAAASRRPPSG